MNALEAGCEAAFKVAGLGDFARQHAGAIEKGVGGLAGAGLGAGIGYATGRDDGDGSGSTRLRNALLGGGIGGVAGIGAGHVVGGGTRRRAAGASAAAEEAYSAARPPTPPDDYGLDLLLAEMDHNAAAFARDTLPFAGFWTPRIAPMAFASPGATKLSSAPWESKLLEYGIGGAGGAIAGGLGTRAFTDDTGMVAGGALAGGAAGAMGVGELMHRRRRSIGRDIESMLPGMHEQVAALMRHHAGEAERNMTTLERAAEVLAQKHDRLMAVAANLPPGVSPSRERALASALEEVRVGEAAIRENMSRVAQRQMDAQMAFDAGRESALAHIRQAVQAPFAADVATPEMRQAVAQQALQQWLDKVNDGDVV